MQKIGYFLVLFVLLLSAKVYGQGGTGTLKVVAVDANTSETLPQVPISVKKNNVAVRGGMTDISGEVSIKPLDPGQYDVFAEFIGYGPVEIKGVLISAGQITSLEVKLSPAGLETGVVVVNYEPPLIDDFVGTTKTRQEIVNLPTRNINSVAATTAGVTQADEGRAVQVRGSRDDATFYFIDGVKVRGSINVPQQGIEQIQVITGGVPAMFGDLTGGVISITTRGPSLQHTGGLEVATSELLDGFGYNLLGLNATGPVFSKKEKDGSRRPLLGYFFAGEFLSERDPNPSNIQNWKVKDDVLAAIEANPLRPGTLGVGTVQNAEFLNKNDFEQVRAKQNIASGRLSLTGKLDFKPTKSTQITVGGQLDYFDRNLENYRFSMFNWNNLGNRVDQTYRGYVKFTQFLGRDDESKPEGEKNASTIKNVYYTIQADYTYNSATQQSNVHQDRLFDYGHNGRFTTFKAPTYDVRVDNLNGIPTLGFWQTGFTDTLVTYSPGTANPTMANYTQQYYNLTGGVAEDNYENIFQIQQGGGLLNGQQPRNIYALFFPAGFQFNGFGKFENTQFRAVANASADIKGHELNIGFEYEQRQDRSYSLAPVGLWGLMRQLANSHIDQLDLSNPLPQFDANGVFTDTINFNRLYNGDAQRFFDVNLRQKLGLPVNGLDFIDTDALDPSTFSLDMFTPDELFNGGGDANLVFYNGYDHTGRRTRGRPTFDDFLNQRDANGNLTRAIGAFEPIYIAGYIQDKFQFKDIVFNIGVRVDRFDANQIVPKDPFVLYDTRKAGEVAPNRPTNIGEDYVVYVRDVTAPTANQIVGYRNGNTWYDAQGTELQDGTLIRQSTTTGIVAPWLVDPQNQRLNSNAFRDYVPQLNVMPRIAFQFPISDVAQFFAHYDVLTQRPTGFVRFDPIEYLFIQNNTDEPINNPNLQPQRTVDYELGYKQKISDRSAITLTAFYRELRNLIQQQAIINAYPTNYTTYGNIDFGTVKGFTAAYDLRRTGNIRLTANYTLQFADGTGSNSGFAAGLISAGLSNLRTPIPLSFDVRHQIQVTFDYRYGRGDDYNGPQGFWRNIFEELGANFVVLANSGTPFTAQSNFTPDAQFGVAARPVLKGQINGSRLPWQFRINARIDKNIEVKWGKKDEKGVRRNTSFVNVYFLVQNILNTRNIISVYPATGNANDDGYLNAPQSQQVINSTLSPAAFRDLYAIGMQNPANFSLPRRMRLGVIFNF